MRAIALAAVLLFSGQPGGDATRPTAEGTFAVRCGTLHVGDGTVLTDATLVIHEGRIEAVGSGSDTPELPDGIVVLDASDKTIMPGIVLADSDLSGHGDSAYNVTPDFVALDGFEFMRRYGRALSGGVTTAYLSPGRNRLISGQGSVVKLHGDDIVQRVLAEEACLRINMGSGATKAPAVFEPTAAPTSDDPLAPARKQAPTARISMLTALRRTFRDAVQPERSRGTGADQDLYSVEPLRRATRGELSVRIGTSEAADVRRALYLGREIGTTVVLEDPREIASVAAEAARQKASAVFRIPVRPGANNPGGENRDPKNTARRPESPAHAASAGVRIAIAPAAADDLADALLVAGIAIRHGLTPAQAMRAITGDAAAILGVADRVGTLAAGKDADFLVLSGAPFSIGTMVEKTFVDGQLAFERNVASDLLAVRAGKIFTMAGPPLRDGLVIVQDGVIKAVGADLAIPFGARVVDLPNGVLVPGFIDAHSHLGLSGSGSGIPKGAADQRIADVVAPDDPLLRQAAEAGLTTVLVSGTDEGTVSGRVAALKTGAKDRDSMVLKETAAIRMVHDAIKADDIKTVADAIDRGRKYIEKWERYEKALAEWKAGKRDEAPQEEVPTEGEKVDDPVTGFWELEIKDAPFPFSMSLDLRLEGTKVSGALVFQFRGQEREIEIEDGKFEGDQLTLSTSSRMGGSITATVGDDTMTGRIEGGFPLEFTGSRVDKPEGDAEEDDADDGSPTKPTIDENLEPIRALIEKRIPAVIRSNKAPAIASVVEWFESNELPFVMTGLEDALDTPEILGPKMPPIVLGPDVVQREGRDTVNAAALLSDRGHAVAIGTGDTAGGRYLPLHAALAVRYGMDPNEALRALTIHAAEMFRLDDRVGSIERGKDADFVVFTGSPFEMTSKVEFVVVNGEVVVDRREDRR